MYRLRDIWKKLLVFFLFFLFLIILQIRNPEIRGPFKGLLGNLLNPFVYYSNFIYKGSIDLLNKYFFLVGVKEENNRIKSELAELMLQNRILSEKLYEYNKLKELLKFKETYKIKAVAAKVVGKHVDGYSKYVIINAGSDDGIELNDSVANELGLVGKVIEVYGKRSKVLLITDPNNKVSVMNLRSRSTGIMSGDGRGGLVVEFYDKLDKVYKDDIFITSGMGGIYVKGMITGKVYAYSNNPSDLFQRVYLNPTVVFSKIENVLVVKNELE
ncbi:MAG: rod shape-determining protein MreC [Calditerrivibrio sp.]|nr:rod shape-determining protein MreC [Calditerrivibrio sp.]